MHIYILISVVFFTNKHNIVAIFHANFYKNFFNLKDKTKSAQKAQTSSKTFSKLYWQKCENRPILQCLQTLKKVS